MFIVLTFGTAQCYPPNMNKRSICILSKMNATIRKKLEITMFPTCNIPAKYTSVDKVTIYQNIGANISTCILTVA